MEKMQVLESKASKRGWCFWSTTESIQNEMPSLTAILETLVAVPLYWWIAVRVGVIQPLLIGVAIAPLVLLRSDESVALGISWLQRFEKNLLGDPIYKNMSDASRCRFWAITALSAAIAIVLTWTIIRHIPFLPQDWQEGIKAVVITIVSPLSFGLFFHGIPIILLTVYPNILTITTISGKLLLKLGEDRPLFVFLALWWAPGYVLGVFIVTVGIRITATLAHLRPGIVALPRNFRRLILCTSPRQIPEVVPGIDGTNSALRFSVYLHELEFDGFSKCIFSSVVTILGILLYFPAWFYRVTIKSTAWFWWPLAFLGGDLRQARNPELFQWKMMGSLWAKTSIALSCASLLTFATANLVLDGTVFQHNPLLTPLGYLLLIDWTPKLWQVCAVLGSLVSLALVFLVNDASGEYRIAHSSGNDGLLNAVERKFGWIERLARLRLLVILLILVPRWGARNTLRQRYSMLVYAFVDIA
jgi:hypothetical protein